MAVWVAGCVMIAFVAFLVVTFNDLVMARNRVRKAWADIDVQLQRRHDLIPQLAATVKGYAVHEQATLATVAALRTRAQDSGSIAQRGRIEGEIAAQVSHLLAMQESYPELKASANFLDLQRQLVAIEDAVQAARGDYNEAVRAYNTQIEQFPDVMLARPFGFAAREFFQAQDTAAVSV